MAKDKYSHRGWLTSEHFWKRAVGVMLYSVAGQLIVWGVVIGIAFLLAFAATIINI